MTRRNYNYKLHGLEPIRSLIFTNRLINHETLHYCFTHFIFRLDSDFDSLLTLMSEFYVQIGKRMRKLIRFVVIPRFSVDTVFFRDGYRSAPAESLPEKYRELVGDMDIAFRKLKGFRALGELQEDGLQQLRAKAAPTRVELVEAPS
ncbi:hypothetical protein COCC4DRAFT_58300 [Bipolaris maydis ATCC 48331]|uniref:Uncharacterized protein n=2 Tax=Cochliobolus heterostrophus TaxID=5016 RepID=M2T9T3_COCH5|nr:uncharacterized protein COCC4DRAFT_58300 [Bipolaris maydis ATCC 48331]EMD94300.1 hypothetical protein COCHEDRAFT_1170202 [Bipolaris maydis C5]ENI07402.1 hypothetical protein COCC4DRAFT_58300 [Bipolaris maydis ATCC 48331]